MPRAMGLSNRVGILIKRRVVPVKNVLFANSSGVSSGRTAAGTVGRLAALIAVKSPPRIRDVGMLLALILTGAKSQRRSYEERKNVLWPTKGTGPPKDPPASFRLKNGLGKVGTAE